MKRRQRREEKEAAMREQVDSVFGQWESEDERDELQAAELTDSVSANTAATVATARENFRVEQQPIANSRAALSEVNPSTFDKCETTTSPKERRKRWRHGIAIVALMLMAMVCALPRLSALLGDKSAQATVASTASSEAKPQPRLLTKPIEEIRCGDRIPSQLPEGLLPEDEPEPDSRTWRLVELELTKANGDKVEVKLLRPLAWLEKAGAVTAGTFPVNVQELDIEGKAAVLKILPCPEIQEGEGQVVTGTFRHVCDSFVKLYTANTSEQIVCTVGHLIWSRDRQQFVKASELSPSEAVELYQSTTRIRKATPLNKSQTVFNIEVNRSHVYHVGTSGLLVHNSILGLEACQRDDGKVSFAHGTTRTSANDIASNGLDADRAKALSLGGSYSHPGAFDAFPVTAIGTGPGNGLAYDMSRRHASPGERAILFGEMDRSVFERLVKEGKIETEFLPGIPEVPQWRFRPDSFTEVAGLILWKILE